MGEKDITEKILFDYNDVFADIINVLIYNGKEVVTEDSLESSGVRSQYKADDSKVHEMERDVAKFWKSHGVTLALYGIENQTKPDNLMPFRMISYDGAAYKSQIVAKCEQPAPVISIVLYFGRDRWNGPKAIKEVLNIPNELDPYVCDYHINVFEMSWLSDEQLGMFKSDFKMVAEYFTMRRRDPNYRPKNKTIIKHVDEMLKLLAVFTGDHRFETLITDEDYREKEGITMCEVLDREFAKGMEKGIEKGMEKGEEKGMAKAILSLVRDGDISKELGAEKLGISIEELELRLMEREY